MAFLTETDYNVQIRASIRNIIAQNNNVTLDTAESMAIEEMKSYLAGKYDCAAIFSATGASRNALIIMYCIDITLYHLHSQAASNNIPELRQTRYNAAIDWLKDVNRDLLNPNLPLLDTSNPSVSITLGGDTKVAEKW